MPDIVYVLTNSAMPGLVKIGKTTRADINERMKQLYGTGVPVPFDCAFACEVEDSASVERALHFAFGLTRINPGREFFEIDPERVVAVLKLLEVTDSTQDVEKIIDNDVPTEDRQSATKLTNARLPCMNFYVIGIPKDSVLVSKDGQFQATVVEERKVMFDNRVCYLTSATRQILNLADDYPIQPSPYWTFNGRTVKEIYEEFYRNLVTQPQ